MVWQHRDVRIITDNWLADLSSLGILTKCFYTSCVLQASFPSGLLIAKEGWRNRGDQHADGVGLSKTRHARLASCVGPGTSNYIFSATLTDQVHGARKRKHVVTVVSCCLTRNSWQDRS